MERKRGQRENDSWREVGGGKRKRARGGERTKSAIVSWGGQITRAGKSLSYTTYITGKTSAATYVHKYRERREREKKREIERE